MAISEEELYEMSDEELIEQMKQEKANATNSEVLEEDEDLADEDASDAELLEDEQDDYEEDELEQPEDEQDSDDNADVDDSEEDADEEEPEEDSEGLDEDATLDSDDNSDTEEEPKEEETQPEQTYKFKANGLEYEFTEQEIKEQFPRVFGQAMDYTKKMQKIKPWRKTIDAIEQAGLSNDDLNLAIDVLKGDKDAIGELLKRTGVDALDLDVEESNYVPKDYGRDETTLALNDVIEEISADQEYQRTQTILGREWDESSWNEFTKEPSLIKALHIDVKTGMYDKVQPIAAKLKVYDGARKADLDYYKEAANIYFSQLNEAEAQAAEAARIAEEQKAAEKAEQARISELKKVEAERRRMESVKKKAVKRKKAAPSSAGVSGGGVTDYLDESDEAFERWYAELQERY